MTVVKTGGVDRLRLHGPTVAARPKVLSTFSGYDRRPRL
jgi:hypothetical protein